MLSRGDSAQCENLKRGEMDGEELACVGFFDAGRIPIGRVAPDAVKLVGGGIGVSQLEGIGDVYVEGLGLLRWIAESEDAFVWAPCGPSVDLSLIHI